MRFCPDCGKEISTRAAACPHCGRRMNPRALSVILLLILAAAVVFAILAFAS